MPITARQLRTQKWNKIYVYPGFSGGTSFEVYSCNIKGITVTHERRGKGKVKISYRVGKRTTDSPTQAVRWWNENERKANGQKAPPGSVSERRANKPA